MDASSETGAAGAPGEALAPAARSAARAARSLAELSAGRDAATPYPAGRSAEFDALAEQLDGAAQELPTVAARAAAAGPDDAGRLGLRWLDLAFDALEASAATVRLAAVDGLRDRRRQLAVDVARCSFEAAAAARAIVGGLEPSEELRLRLRIADAIGAEVRGIVGADAAAEIADPNR